MGHLLDGKWTNENVLTNHDKTGLYFKRESVFRHRIEAGSDFLPEPGRYHLYCAVACPWAHRATLMRALKKLEPYVTLTDTFQEPGGQGWSFGEQGHIVPGTDRRVRWLHELYSIADPGCTTRVTVPTLWDAKTRRIVNNESSEIIRMMGAGLYPQKLRAEIDAVNDRVYRTVNNGVYRAGFATAQDKYEAAVSELFASLDWLEKRLAKRRWLCGAKLTEADVRLFTTLVRFDAVYYSHFKCNLRRLVDYPRLWRYTRRFYALPGVARTVDLAEIKSHYYRSQKHVNPTQIVPKGPLDLRLR